MTISARVNTPARWQAALKRALDERVQVRQLAGCGMWIATITSNAGTAYEVTLWESERHAGQFGDPVCKHRAALCVRLGWLAFEPGHEPEPPAVVAVVVRVAETPCHSCGGHSWGYGIVEGGRMDRMTCWVCGGSGVERAAATA